jgi:hypothetical protein
VNVHSCNTRMTQANLMCISALLNCFQIMLFLP